MTKQGKKEMAELNRVLLKLSPKIMLQFLQLPGSPVLRFYKDGAITARNRFVEELSWVANAYDTESVALGVIWRWKDDRFVGLTGPDAIEKLFTCIECRPGTKEVINFIKKMARQNLQVFIYEREKKERKKTWAI